MEGPVAQLKGAAVMTTNEKLAKRTLFKAVVAPDAGLATAAAEADAAEAEADAAEARADAARARVLALRQRVRASGLDCSDSAADLSAVAATGVIDTGEPSTETDTGEAAQHRDERRRQRLSPRHVRAGLTAATGCVLICALFGTGGYLAWKHRGVVQERQRSAEFTAGARRSVTALTSLDFHTAKQDVQRLLDHSTGEFKREFQTNVDDFTKALEQSKVVTVGTVNAAAVDSMTGNTAVVLVAATSEVTNVQGVKQESRSWRLSVSMIDEGGQIKMARAEFVS